MIPPRALRSLGIAALLASSAAADSAFDYIEVESPALRKDVRVGVYLPPGYDDEAERRYPTVYFLHGMFGNERKWESRGMPDKLDALIESGEAAPMIVVCPNGENSMYVDWKNGKADWKEFVHRDLVAEVDRRFRTIPTRAARGLSGDSMGGYGALNITFQHPDVFGSVSAHSAALYPVDPDDLPEWIKRRAKSWAPVFGAPPDEEMWRANNPLHLAATVDKAVLDSLSIYFDCGNRDDYGFHTWNADLAGILEDRDVAHEFHLLDGGHGRRYFAAYADRSLAFHGRTFKAALSAPPEGPSTPPSRDL